MEVVLLRWPIAPGGGMFSLADKNFAKDCTGALRACLGRGETEGLLARQHKIRGGEERNNNFQFDE